MGLRNKKPVTMPTKIYIYAVKKIRQILIISTEDSIIEK